MTTTQRDDHPTERVERVERFEQAALLIVALVRAITNPKRA